MVVPTQACAFGTRKEDILGSHVEVFKRDGVQPGTAFHGFDSRNRKGHVEFHPLLDALQVQKPFRTLLLCDIYFHWSDSVLHTSDS